MASTTATASDPSGAVPVPKHRACDECRTRKLACTKEADGCSRCKREGIACHYSPQKPMGRPRKRPRDQTNETPADHAAIDAPAPKTMMTDLPPMTADPGMEFINFLTGDFGFGSGSSSSHSQQQPIDAMCEARETGSPWRFGYTGDALGDLNFDDAAELMPQDQIQIPSSYSSSANIDPALFASSSFLSDPHLDSVPDLSPPSASASTPESSASSGGNTATTPTCACTASLYLALDSMQKLPADVTDGVRQARHAARTAYQVVNCPVCSASFEHPGSARYQHQPELEPLQQPPSPIPIPIPMRIHNFQNLMLLGTLIPSIAHAYERILAAVDRETAAAQRERRQLVFRLRGLGGVWGPLGDDADGGCGGATQAFDHREMEPAMWRLTVRALLKLDVYGLYGDRHCDVGRLGIGGSGGVADPLHLGLKDIVAMMESRSRARHAVMDAMVLAGAWPDPPCTMKLYGPGETPTCQQIISIAKRSIEQLVIA